MGRDIVGSMCVTLFGAPVRALSAGVLVATVLSACSGEDSSRSVDGSATSANAASSTRADDVAETHNSNSPNQADAEMDSTPAADSSAATEPVPAPAGEGSIDKKVEVEPLQILATVSVDHTVEPVEGFRIRVSLSPTEVEGRGVVGEVSGPGVEVLAIAENSSSENLDLTQSQVAVTESSGAPLTPVIADSPRLPENLAPGQTATGTYVFLLASANFESLLIDFQTTPGAPIAQFSGSLK